MALPASDTFNRANESPIGGNWTTGFATFGDIRLVTNSVQKVGVASNAGCYWNADSFDSDHYSQMVPIDLSNDNAGPAIRMQTGAADRNCYVLCNRNTTVQRIKKVVAGVITQLGSDYSVTLVSGTSVAKIRAVGSTITISIDGVDSGTTQTDSSLTGGAAGFFDATGQGHDTWGGGNVSAGATVGGPVLSGRAISPGRIFGGSALIA